MGSEMCIRDSGRLKGFHFRAMRRKCFLLRLPNDSFGRQGVILITRTKNNHSTHRQSRNTHPTQQQVAPRVTVTRNVTDGIAMLAKNTFRTPPDVAPTPSGTNPFSAPPSPDWTTPPAGSRTRARTPTEPPRTTLTKSSSRDRTASAWPSPQTPQVSAGHAWAPRPQGGHPAALNETR